MNEIRMFVPLPGGLLDMKITTIEALPSGAYTLVARLAQAVDDYVQAVREVEG